eukprot:scaffold19171_cov45-Phaeocystis_antarctica.AAC.1
MATLAMATLTMTHPAARNPVYPGCNPVSHHRLLTILGTRHHRLLPGHRTGRAEGGRCLGSGGWRCPRPHRS